MKIRRSAIIMAKRFPTIFESLTRRFGDNHFILNLLMALCMLPIFAFAQVDTVWTRIYNTPGSDNDFTRGCAVDDSGYLYVTGYFNSGANDDYLTIKYNPATRETIWIKMYNGPAKNNDRAFACVVGDSGYLYVTGQSYNGSNDDFLTIKYNPVTGDTIWTKRYDWSNQSDRAYACAIDDSGYLYVTGENNWDFLTVKYNTITGDAVWARTYNGPGNDKDIARACAVDDSGYLYVTGQTRNPNYDYMTVKYNTVTGNTIWTKTFNSYSTRYDEPYGCAVDDSGYLYVTGISSNGSNHDCLTIKYNTITGDTIWTRRYNGPGNFDDRAYGCVVDSAKYLYVAAHLYNGSSWDCLLLKYNTAGVLQLTETYDGPVSGDDKYLECVLDDSGYVYFIGESSNGTNIDFLTMKYSPVNEDTIWSERYNGSVNRSDYAYDCVLDNAGYLYVTGVSSNGANIDFLTIKYDPATGDTVWTRRYNGTENRDDRARGCAVDDSGNLYVTGYIYNGSNDDILTVKYNAITGDTIWARRYTYTGTSNEYANDCAMDDSGYLYVFGDVSSTVVPNYNYLTIKYNALTGDTIWTRHYDNPWHQNDWGIDGAVDDSGYAYITGGAYNGFTYDCLTVKYHPVGDTVWTKMYNFYNTDDEGYACVVDDSGYLYVAGFTHYSNHNYMILKYNSATGAEVWAKTYNGTANNIDEAYGCAVDYPGFLYVTGSSHNGSDNDVLTIKYNAITGDTIWTTRYNGPANDYDRGSACAVDDSGYLYVVGGTNSGINDDFLVIKYNTVPTGVEGAHDRQQAKCKLMQNYPNPFRVRTNIRYRLAEGRGEQQVVYLKIYNAAGQLVKTLVDSPRGSGLNSIPWDGRDESGKRVAPGVYFSKLEAADYSATKKMILIR